MASARDQMKTIDAELAEVREKLDRLKVEESVLVRLKAKLSGEPESVAINDKPRKRVANVKPMVLDVVHEASTAGISSLEATQKVQEREPAVTKETVGSVLSRLKSEGAFVYVGDRYYEKQFAPPNGQGAWSGVRVVN